MIPSLLYLPNKAKVSTLDECVFTDLKISKLLEFILSSYNDCKDLEEMMQDIPDIDSLKYRQEIFTDILNDTNQELKKIYYSIITLNNRFKSYSEAKELTKRNCFFIIYLKYYYDLLKDIIRCFDKIKPNSFAFTKINSIIKTKLESKEDKELITKVNEYYDLIMKSFNFNCEFHDGAPHYELSYDKKNDLETILLDISKSLNIPIESTYVQSKRKEINPYFLHAISLKNSKLYETINKFYQENYLNLVDFISTEKELRYYFNLLEIFDFIKSKDVPVSKSIINNSGFTSIKDAYDVSLLISNKTIIPNDYISELNKNISFVLGVNSGGKTCYLRSIAINYCFFLNVGYMFSRFSEVNYVSNLFTHFPNEENYSFGEGRLYDELKRLKRMKKHFSKDTIIFMNETFSSTSEEIAYSYTKELLNDISDTAVKIVFVTHQYKIFEEISDDRIYFYTPVVMDENNIRTYKIKKVEKSLLSYAQDILKKYGLTKEELAKKKRI